MRNSIRIMLLAALPLVALQAHADEDNLNFGAGIGFTYSGLGGFASYTENNQTFAFSAGAISLGGNGTNIGAGVSWLRTDWFGSGSNNRHAAGLYLGAVGSENYRRNDQSSVTRRTTWGGGPVYQFYQNGISQSGFVGGAAILVGDEVNDTDTSVRFSLGYQF